MKLEERRARYRSTNYSNWMGVLVGALIVLFAAVYLSIGLAALGHAAELEPVVFEPAGIELEEPPEVPAPPVSTLMVATATEFRVNLNVADAAQLALVPGLGPTRVKEILAWRERHSFQVPADLMKVKGFGLRTYAKVKPFLVVDGPAVQGTPPKKPRRRR